MTIVFFELKLKIDPSKDFIKALVMALEKAITGFAKSLNTVKKI